MMGRLAISTVNSDLNQKTIISYVPDRFIVIFSDVIKDYFFEQTKFYFLQINCYSYRYVVGEGEWEVRDDWGGQRRLLLPLQGEEEGGPHSHQLQVPEVPTGNIYKCQKCHQLQVSEVPTGKKYKCENRSARPTATNCKCQKCLQVTSTRARSASTASNTKLPVPFEDTVS